MKPSEMTNERIAEELIATIPHLSDEAWSCTDADDILRESAARLRKMDVLKMKVSELRECLKETMADAVAEYKNNSCFRNVKCGEIERCKTCKVDRWRNALRKEGSEKLRMR